MAIPPSQVFFLASFLPSPSHFELLSVQTLHTCLHLSAGSTVNMPVEEGASGPKHLNSSELLKKIDKLREKNIGKYVPLPQVRLCHLQNPSTSGTNIIKLVVVGDQSSGKSSLLASLTKIPFPRDMELCTRYATQITSRREDDRSVEISIIPAVDASAEHRAKVQGYKKTLRGTEDFRSEFPTILQEVRLAQNHMCL